jgi:hypothetical protein
LGTGGAEYALLALAADHMFFAPTVELLEALTGTEGGPGGGGYALLEYGLAAAL